MSRTDDCVLVADAIRQLHAAAGLPWPPPANRTIVPVPLDRLIRSQKNLEHFEVPELTPAIAGVYLTSAGGHWPELLKDNTELDGLLVANVSGGYIFVRVDANNPVPRRRFTAAHELGHFLLHFLPSLESQRDPDVPFVRADNEETLYKGKRIENDKALSLLEMKMEREANQFAAELLMPESVCRAACEHYKGRFRTTSRFLEHHLARELLVSLKAVELRLQSLNLAN